MRKKKSFTLLELMIVVIVLGIIASFVIPGYFGVQRKAREREAKAMLGLILTKQKSLHLETGQYTGCSDTEIILDIFRSYSCRHRSRGFLRPS
jgi:prepilin-type N-terminal cleavage/methylation domain-containing protein